MWFCLHTAYTRAQAGNVKVWCNIGKDAEREPQTQHFHYELQRRAKTSIAFSAYSRAYVRENSSMKSVGMFWDRRQSVEKNSNEVHKVVLI